MPIIRKLIRVGDSKAVTIPKSWLRFYEDEHHVKIEELAVEVNRILKIEPILPKKKATRNE